MPKVARFERGSGNARTQNLREGLGEPRNRPFCDPVFLAPSSSHLRTAAPPRQDADACLRHAGVELRVGDDLVHMQKCLAAAAQRQTEGGRHHGMRSVFEAEKAFLTVEQKGVEPREVAGLHQPEQMRQIRATGESAWMV